MLIGQKLKELRLQAKMSLTELSEQSGVQLATLSRMENLKMTGTLESHIAITKALGVSLTDLYKDIAVEEKRIEVRKSQTPNDVFVHSDKSSYEILTGKVMSKKMMPILLKIEPGGKTNTEQNVPGTEKFVFVLEGTIEIHIKEETYPLSKHNTLYFDAALPHYFVNKAKAPARVICVITPVAL
ncbi:MAG TPA: XRE family transcriptional regulator [Candidatus Omnitrophota bacterium]|nr:XRE family transcriptional regulator [Candidatus Omnitrophota bacterium]HPD85635.1 XRE family transcriptional regulator [Candidatus Omnitrophota bacterium]HRZ04478.1 XRE family transcriptional regulator [Candidatus Omnitrophota bacterium]